MKDVTQKPGVVMVDFVPDLCEYDNDFEERADVQYLFQICSENNYQLERVSKIFRVAPRTPTFRILVRSQYETAEVVDHLQYALAPFNVTITYVDVDRVVYSVFPSLLPGVGISPIGTQVQAQRVGRLNDVFVSATTECIWQSNDHKVGWEVISE